MRDDCPEVPPGCSIGWPAPADDDRAPHPASSIAWAAVIDIAWAAVIDRIAADVDELARARRVEDLDTAAVLPDRRAERRRRLAEPDLWAWTAWRDLRELWVIYYQPVGEAVEGLVPVGDLGDLFPQPGFRQVAQQRRRGALGRNMLR